MLKWFLGSRWGRQMGEGLSKRYLGSRLRKEKVRLDVSVQSSLGNPNGTSGTMQSEWL